MGVSVDFAKPITSVWSSYGHVFHGTDNPTYESCMTCGAEYVLRNLGDGEGEYLTNGGEPPTYCTGDISMAHGYERICEVDNGRPCETNAETGVCKHTNHECNCVQCD
jgi:hypothetical protein